MQRKIGFQSLEVYLEQFKARLFPLRKCKLGDPESKRPLGRWGDSKRIPIERLEQYLEAGNALGWALGPEDLIVDVDAPTPERPDKRGLESLARLKAEKGIDLEALATVVVEGPSGGRHYYLTKPAGLEVEGKLEGYPGIEFLSAGRYVVIAGSPHWQGGEYAFDEVSTLAGDFERKAAPAALLELIERKLVEPGDDKSAGSWTPELLKKALAVLDPTSRREYQDWRNLLFASHAATGGSKEGLEVFVSWSTSDPKYAGAGADIRKIWTKAGKRHGITPATLLAAVREVDPNVAAAIDFKPAPLSAALDFEGDPLEDRNGRKPITVLEGRTDLENSLRFVDMFEGRILYVQEWKKWIAWDGSRWATGSAALRFAKQYAKNLWKGAKKWDRLSQKELLEVQRFVKATSGANSIACFMKLAESDRRVACQVAELNQHPTLLNVRNGTIDLVTGEIKPADPQQKISQVAPVAFDPAAKCPQWLEFLDLVFGSKKGLIRYVQQLLGYSCSGLAIEHVLPICWGEGNNGKSTLWGVIQNILGNDYSAVCRQELLLPLKDQHPTEVAALYGRRFSPVAEIDAGRRLNEATVKSLTGGDRIKARRMREDFWDFDPTHTFWLSSNHKPKVTGTDEGIWRRIKLIPFEVNIAKKVSKVETGFGARLVAEEGSGILNWLIEGFQDWKRNGFAEPEEVQLATKNYREAEDIVGRFVDDQCEACPPGKESPIWDIYQRFFVTVGKSPAREGFVKALEAKGFKRFRLTKGEHRNKYAFEGLRLIAGEPLPESS